MSQTKILVKVNPEGKYVVDLGKGIDVTKCTPHFFFFHWIACPD